MSFNEFKKAINKKYKKNILSSGSESIQMPRIPTGSLSLDIETGGGIPIGRITSVIGEFSDGKTAIVLKIVANFQEHFHNRTVLWIDAEGSWDKEWAETLGVNTNNVELLRPEFTQQAFDVAEQAVIHDVGLIVIDSIAALVPKEEAEATMEDWQVGLSARLNGKFFRKMHSALHEYDKDLPPTVIYINQLRNNLSGYGPTLQEPGGEILRFAPSLKIRIKKGDLYPESKSHKHEDVQPKAQQVRFHIEKNRTASPFRRGHFWFYFDTMDSYRAKGTYDTLEELIRYGLKLNVIRQAGKWYYLPDLKTGEEMSFDGSGRLATYIRENEAMWQWLDEKVRAANGKEEIVISKNGDGIQKSEDILDGEGDDEEKGNEEG